MKSLYLAALGLTALLAACEEKAATNATALANTAEGLGTKSGDMGNMAMPAEAKMAKSTGIVTAIDKSAGKITLAHEAMAEVNWPAMTMAFTAKPALLDGVAVGDKVAFNVTIKGSAGEVTAVSKQ